MRDQYLELRKVEPMRRALKTLGINTWFAGLRRSQAESRARLNPLEGDFRLFHVVKGKRTMLGKPVQVSEAAGTWHTIRIVHVDLLRSPPVY